MPGFPSLAPGLVFAGRYRIVALAGRGGVGEVYEAVDTRLLRTVALKILSSVAVDAPLMESKLLHEARAAAAIEHPHIVAVYDVGVSEGLPYLTMELVTGRSLRTFIGDRSISIGQRLAWLLDVAHALGAAHQRGIAHRDVKPENVMITSRGEAKVLDFGIARELADVVLRDPSREAPGSGTPGYMAPEQWLEGRGDARGDQYAWAVVAWELLAGQRPRSGAASISPEPSSVMPALPESVWSTLRRALALGATERFDSVEDAATKLQESLQRYLSSAVDSSPPRNLSDLSLRAASLDGRGAGRGSVWMMGAAASLASAALVFVIARRGAPVDSVAAAKSSSVSFASARGADGMGLERARRLLEDGAPEAAVENLSPLLEREATASPAHLINALAVADNETLLRAHLAAVREESLDPDERAILHALRDDSAASVPKAPIARRWAFWARGRRALARGDVDDAMATAQVLVGEAPRMAAAHLLHAEALRANGQDGEALEASNRCLTLAPASAGCLKLAAEMYGAAGECDTSMALARRLIATRPDTTEGFELLAASAAFVDPTLAESLRAFEQKALRLPRERRDGVLRLDRASLALQRGDWAEAKVLLAPTSDTAMARDRMQHLRDDLRRVSKDDGGPSLETCRCSLDTPVAQARQRLRAAQSHATAGDWPAACRGLASLRRQWQNAFPTGVGSTAQRLWEQGRCALVTTRDDGAPQP